MSVEHFEKIRCFTLYNEFKLEPIIIACTIESSVYMRFGLGKAELTIETYNEGDIVALVNKDKQILFSEEIINFNFDRCIDVLKKAEQDKVEASNET